MRAHDDKRVSLESLDPTAALKALLAVDPEPSHAENGTHRRPREAITTI